MMKNYWPDLVIMGGAVLDAEDEDSSKKSYLFQNEGVDYVVGYGETHHESEEYNTYHEFLIVSKNGKQLLKQERLFNSD